MRLAIFLFGALLAIGLPFGMSYLAANWLLAAIWPEVLGWVWGLITAVFLTLLAIPAWYFYQDTIWEGLMNPFAFLPTIILFLIGLLTLPSLYGQLQLVDEGKTTVAEVTKRDTNIDFDTESGTSTTEYHLTYQFETEAGESYEQRVTVVRAFYEQIQVGETLTVVYLPNRPRYSLPQTLVRPQNRARQAFTALLMVFAVLGETAVIQRLWGRRIESFIKHWQ